jgi:hypothetical protein
MLAQGWLLALVELKQCCWWWFNQQLAWLLWDVADGADTTTAAPAVSRVLQ